MNLLLALCLGLQSADASSSDSAATETERQVAIDILQKLEEKSSTNPCVRFRVETRVRVSKAPLNRNRVTTHDITFCDGLFSCIMVDARPGQIEFPLRQEAFSFDGTYLRQLPGPDPSAPKDMHILASQDTIDGGLKEIFQDREGAIGSLIEPRTLFVPARPGAYLGMSLNRKRGNFSATELEMAHDTEHFETRLLPSTDGSSDIVQIEIHSRAGQPIRDGRLAVRTATTVNRELLRLVSYRCETAETVEGLSKPESVRTQMANVRWGSPADIFPQGFTFTRTHRNETIHDEETTISVVDLLAEQPDLSTTYGWTALRPEKGRWAEFDDTDESLVWDGMAFIPFVPASFSQTSPVVPTGSPSSVSWWLIANLAILPFAIYFILTRFQARWSR